MDTNREFISEANKLHHILTILDFDWSRGGTWDEAYDWIPQGVKQLRTKVDALKEKWLNEKAHIDEAHQMD